MAVRLSALRESVYGTKRKFLTSVVDPTDILFINSSLVVHSISSLHKCVYLLSFLDVTPCKAIVIDTYLLGLLFTLTMEAIRTFLQIVANIHGTAWRQSSEVCKLFLLFTAVRTSDRSFLNVEVIGLYRIQYITSSLSSSSASPFTPIGLFSLHSNLLWSINNLIELKTFLFSSWILILGLLYDFLPYLQHVFTFVSVWISACIINTNTTYRLAQSMKLTGRTK
jgi:hypothetical protein